MTDFVCEKQNLISATDIRISDTEIKELGLVKILYYFLKIHK